MGCKSSCIAFHYEISHRNQLGWRRMDLNNKWKCIYTHTHTHIYVYICDCCFVSYFFKIWGSYPVIRFRIKENWSNIRRSAIRAFSVFHQSSAVSFIISLNQHQLISQLKAVSIYLFFFCFSFFYCTINDAAAAVAVAAASS